MPNLTPHDPQPVVEYTVDELAALCGRFAALGWECHALAAAPTQLKPGDPLTAFSTNPDGFARTVEAIRGLTEALRADPVTAPVIAGMRLEPVIAKRTQPKPGKKITPGWQPRPRLRP